jgi:hypothetical protein
MREKIPDMIVSSSRLPFVSNIEIGRILAGISAIEAPMTQIHVLSRE